MQKATNDWKGKNPCCVLQPIGIKIPVEIKVENRIVFVTVLPSASSLILKALKEPPRDRKKVKNIKHDGNLKFEEVLEIARTMKHKSMAKTFKGTVKQILGTAVAIGCTVDGKPAKVVSELVENGDYLCKE